LPFASCCGRYLAAPGLDAMAAPDAESLMRSRYTAFVCERADYLQATWHASTRPATLDFDAGAKWLGLDVRRYATTDADHAVVEFVARYRVAGRAVRLHETSRFVREGGRWFMSMETCMAEIQPKTTPGDSATCLDSYEI